MEIFILIAGRLSSEILRLAVEKQNARTRGKERSLHDPFFTSFLAYLDLSADLPGLYHNKRLVLRGGGSAAGVPGR